jgi:signal transduction histidine kinase
VLDLEAAGDHDRSVEYYAHAEGAVAGLAISPEVVDAHFGSSWAGRADVRM